MLLQRLHRTGRYYHRQTVRHVYRILKTRDHAPSWIWMSICALSTLLPLLVGYARGEISYAIYGALTGYFIGLSDHPGSLQNRLLIATIALIADCFCFAAGISLHDQLWVFASFTLAAVYLLGLFGGKGAELERLTVFALITLLVARYAWWLPQQAIPALLFYFLIAYGAAVAVIVISRVVHPKHRSFFVSAKDSFHQMLTWSPMRHFHALSYACAIGLAIFCVEFFKIQRGYWTVVTVLLVLKPDRKESFYRVFQRLFGSLLGVFVGELLILCRLPIPALILVVTLCAFFVPYVWKRNYWLVTFLATNLVILLLSMSQYGHLEHNIVWVRLQATLYGCGISLVVLLGFRSLERFLPLGRR